MSDLADVLLNRGNKNRRQDNFYVKFLNMEENVGNYLGGQVKSVTRPDITVEVSRPSNKAARHVSPAQIRFGDADLVFFDDEEGLVSMLLYAQLLRQAGRYSAEVDRFFDNDESYKKGRFGMHIGLYNSRREETEGYILEDCLVTSITHDESVQSGGDQDATIRVRVSADNLQLKVFDSFLALFT